MLKHIKSHLKNKVQSKIKIDDNKIKVEFSCNKKEEALHLFK